MKNGNIKMLSITLIFTVLASARAAVTKSSSCTASSSSSSLPVAFCNHHPPTSRFASNLSRRDTSIMRHSANDSKSDLPTKRVVLIGGGHAHVQVLKALNAHSRPSHLHVTLIDLQSSASYSGMVPGCVSKLYTLDQVQITLDSLANWSGIEFVCGKVVGMSFEENDGQKLVLVEETDDSGSVTKKEVPFDVVSVDIGSTTRDFTSIPGANEYTISTRPISDLVVRIQKEEEMLKEKLSTGGISTGAQVVVVGGGAAGIELSLALRARWNDMLDSKLSITLIDRNDMLFPSETSACRSALKNVMEKYNIEVRHNLLVDEVTSSHIHVTSIANSDGSSNQKDKIPYTHCIWATGAESHPLSWDLHKQCGLAVSPDRGWIRVNQHMQSLSHPSVFAAGDCCEIVYENRKSPPKAGVFAVRSGPILIENLTRFLGANPHSKTDGEAGSNELITYDPQDDFLKLLMCGDGTALGFRFGVPIYGKWVWELKDYIDQMFMDLFDVNNLPTYTKSGKEEKGDNSDEDSGDAEFDTSQYDTTYEAAKERMTAEDAGKLLLRRDDGVDFQIAWTVLREMMADEKYKEEVLLLVHNSPDVWW